MTVNDIYAIAKQLMFEKPSSTIYDNYVIQNTNRVLYELFEANNMERMWNGKAPLTERVKVSLRTDEVPYEDLYCQEIIPKGLAAYFLIDDDMQKYGVYYADYQNARIINQKVIPQDVIDSYSEL